MLLSACVFGYGAVHLGLILTAKPSENAIEQGPGTNPQAAQTAQKAGADKTWPAAFGQVKAQPKQAAVTVVSNSYQLKGLVAGRGRSWAIVSGKEGDTLVHKGDQLPGGEQVVRIDDKGVWITQAGKEQLIDFETDPDQSAPQPAAAQAFAGNPEAPLQMKADLALADFRGRDFWRVLAGAGGIKIVEISEGVMAQEILWVRNGQLYDSIGLQGGDVVVSLNGIPAGDTDALMSAMPKLLGQRQFELEIIRAGAVRTITVDVKDDS
ncbi:MAG: hypothetical protein CSA68_11550 [Rhodobacterales bacterium]|nr:MAG: hypothetical protein CSA68_11550 [Rhodobacterales bacterium]